MAGKFSTVILFLICFANIAFGQSGGFYLSQFTPNRGEIDNQNFDIAQDRTGVMYMANRGGVAMFDGVRWELIKTPHSIFSLAIDTTESILYTAGKGGIGKLIKGKNNDLEYHPLLDSTYEQVADVFALELYAGQLYSLNQKNVFIYNLETKKLNTISSDYSGDLLGIFQLGGDVYVNTSISGLKLVGESKLENSPVLSLRDTSVSILIKDKKQEKYLIGFSDNSLNIYKNGKLEALDLKSDQEYLNQAEIIDGIWVNDSLTAVSTLKGGVVFVNIVEGKIEEIVNYQSGLPDNEIYALAIDSYDGVWVAHAEGFTRVSPTFPFRSFSRYGGLEGKALSVNSHDGQLYVGTTLGLYYLDEIERYTENVSVTKKNIRIRVNNRARTQEQKPRRGVFKFLRRNKEGRKKTTVNDDIQYRQKTIYDSIVERSLDGVNYRYKKIAGINSKVFQLESYQNMLFSGGLDGLYLLNDTTVQVITEDPVRYYFIAEDHQKIIVNTYTDQLKVYDIKTESLSEVYAFGDFRDFVQYIFEDHMGRIWFCSPDEVYWVKFEGNELVDTERFPINNPHYFTTYGGVSRDSVIFVNEQGTHYFNEKANKLQSLKSKKKLPERYLAGPSGTAYANHNGRWSQLGSDKDKDKLDLISLFKNVSYISTDKRDNYWIITDQNELYGLSADGENSHLAPYSLFLKKASNNAKSFLPTANLKFDQDHSALSFEVAQPEYSGILDIEYQYKLKGLPSKWSSWSVKHNIITFPYLPDGKYELLIRSKTALGAVTKMKPIAFKVVPPYWKRPWFYFLEFSFIALLLFISIKIKKLGYRYRLMSRLLALLVLIIVVEFIQTVAENKFGKQSSPVLDFIIQVTMAIIILPVESVLRKYIFKEKQVNVMDFITLKDKKKPKPE